jgi:putative ABC transport system permease protein
VLALAQAAWLVRTLSTLVPRGTLVVGRVGIDGSALLFLLATTIAAAVACAVIPALRLSRIDVAGRLGSRGTTGTRGRLRHVLVAGEVGISVILLAGAGLLLQSVRELQRAQGGFSTERVHVMRIRGFSQGPGDVYGRYLERMATVPGVERVSAASSALPGRPSVAFSVVGAAPPSASLRRQVTSYQMVSGAYFSTMGIPLEAGRSFTTDDVTGKPPVAIVNRALAERFFDGGSALGRQIRAGDGPRDATMTIVGVVGNVRPPFATGDDPQLYVPYTQQGEPNMALIVKTTPGTPLPIAQLKQAIWSVEPRQAVFGVGSLDEQLAVATSSQRAIAVLLGGFAILALTISLSGIYTVVSYLVSRRFKEIAVRRAIGAGAGDVVRSLAGPTLRWTIAGLIAGAAGAAGGSRLLRAAVTGVLPLELPLMTAILAAYFLVVALVVAVAARGALRIDPVAALRAE